VLPGIEQTSSRLPNFSERNDALERRRPKPVPMMTPKPPADFVGRPNEFDALKKQLPDRKRNAVVAITAALKGAGGLAKLPHDRDIRDAYVDGDDWLIGGAGAGCGLAVSAKALDLVEVRRVARLSCRIGRSRPELSAVLQNKWGHL
jgi:hypothetical protein